MSKNKSKDSKTQGEITIEVSDSGGIDHDTFTFQPGTTILSGRNATNRTSLIEAVNTAYGGSAATVRETVDEGQITLTTADSEYTIRTKESGDGTVVRGDRPVEDDHKQAAIDLFATVTADNSIRQAIRAGGDGDRLKELLMLPVDTDDIEERVAELKRQREVKQSRLNEIQAAKERLTELRERRQQAKEEAEEIDEKLSAAKSEAAAQTDIESIRTEQEELDTALNELEDKQSRLESLESEIQIAERAINETEVEIQSAQAELAQLNAQPTDSTDDIDQRISELQDKRTTLDTEVSEVEGIIKFNTARLNDDTTRIIGEATDDDERKSITEELVEESITCWTCGQQASKEEVQQTIDVLRDIASERRERLSEVESELSSLRDDKQDIRAHKQKVASAEERVETLENKLTERRGRLDRLKNNIEEVESEIAEKKDEIESFDIEEAEQDAIDAQQRVNELEREKGRLETRIEKTNEKIESEEETAAEEQDVREEIETLTDEIEELRATVSNREQAIVDSFNEAADHLYDALGYENIGRIWLERIHKDDSTEANPDTVFKLHTVREVDGNTAESPVGTLSESERELVGVTLALAGYVAHGVGEYMPILLLDSLEAIDAHRVDAMLDYISDHAEHVVATTLPEDEPVLADEYERVRFGEQEAQ